jgi:hypothetical protein
METSKNNLNENFSLDWSPYPPESLLKKRDRRIQDTKRKLVPDNRQIKPKTSTPGK